MILGVIIGIIFIMFCFSVLYYAFKDKIKNYNLNYNLLNSLKKKEYNFDKKLYLNDYNSYNSDKLYKLILFIDTQKEKILLIDYKKSMQYILNFSEIVNYQIYENDVMIINGKNPNNAMRMFTYGANETCKSLQLIIKTNSSKQPQICYNIIGGSFLNLGVGKFSDIYKKCVRTLQEVIVELENIKNLSK